MKNLIIVNSLILFLCSCEMFKSKDELLTEKEWVLFSRSYLNSSSKNLISKHVYFKKAHQAIVIKFKQNGLAYFSVANEKINSTVLWRWLDAEKNHISLQGESYFGDFKVNTLNSNDLKWQRLGGFTNDAPYENFKHLDDPDWSDAKIEILNSESTKLFRD